MTGYTPVPPRKSKEEEGKKYDINKRHRKKEKKREKERKKGERPMKRSKAARG